MVGKESGIRYAEQTAKQKDRPANTLISLTPLYRTEETALLLPERIYIQHLRFGSLRPLNASFWAIMWVLNPQLGTVRPL